MASTGLLSRVASSFAGKLGTQDRPELSMSRIARLGMTERQQELNAYWAFYRGQQYAARKLDWSGKEITSRVDSDVIASQGYIPPGFIDVGRQGKSALPLKFRKPTAPYALITTIVDRFSGLLFSENQHPEIKVDGDPVTEDFLRGVADVTRLWQQMIQARAYGGGMGSTAAGFQFVEGRPVVEIHDPRWCFPDFVEHGSMTLKKIEKRYRYFKEERDETTGNWVKKEYWYRRIIDEVSDTLFAPAPVDDGDEPEWQIARKVDHNFGFCPVVWIQNLPVQDSEDGDPDCPPAVYENVEAMDALISQANRALVANCDPTLVITTKADMNEVSVGSDNALKVPDGDAKFLEIAGSGPEAAGKFVEELRKRSLEMAQCVLEHPDVAGKTATEVERMYQSMLSKADVLREQYGQKGVLPLLEMIFKAAQKLGQPRQLDAVPPADPSIPNEADPLDGNIPVQPPPPAPVQVATMVRETVVLPPRYEKNPETGSMTAVPRQPGSGGNINLKWPGYFQPTLTDIQLAATAATAALAGGVIDDKTAIEFVAAYFKVEDVADLVQRVRQSALEKQSQLDMMALGVTGQDQPGVDPAHTAPADGAPSAGAPSGEIS